jgi:hypothetical protein
MPLSTAAVKQMCSSPLSNAPVWGNNPAMNRSRQFASDNYSGVCPEAWAAMAEANNGHEVSYGNDS